MGVVNCLHSFAFSAQHIGCDWRPMHPTKTYDTIDIGTELFADFCFPEVFAKQISPRIYCIPRQPVRGVSGRTWREYVENSGALGFWARGPRPGRGGGRGAEARILGIFYFNR